MRKDSEDLGDGEGLRRGRGAQRASDTKNEYGNRDRRKRKCGQSKAKAQGDIGTIGIIRPGPQAAGWRQLS
jgi:hypothetical protein